MFRRGVIAALALLVVGLAWWVRRSPDEVAARTYPAVRIVAHADDEALDRIVLVTIDTLRADHLGSYGYPRDTSPFLDALAEHGVRFEQSMTCISTTTPAHASLFTSLYPLEHGVTMNGHRLGAEPATLAEMLNAAGYLTAGFASTNTHFGPGGLDRGFQMFDEPRGDRRFRPAGETIDAALAWLDGRAADERFFLWIHLFDPHHSHRAPRRFARELRAADELGREQLAAFVIEEQRAEPGFFDDDPEKLLDVMDDYDGAILYADRELGRLYARLQADGLGPRTLWLVTSDHGEGLGNHSWMTHGKHIYNEQLRVPLIFHFSSRSLGPLEVRTLVENVDVLPTVLELIGEEPAGRGASLVPLIYPDQGAFGRKSAFAQRRSFDPRDRPPQDELEEENYEAGRKFAIQNGSYKYILHTTGENELYDLTDDPYETRNLVGSGVPAEASLGAELLELVRAFEQQSPEGEYVDEETLEGLRELGYVR